MAKARLRAHLLIMSYTNASPGKQALVRGLLQSCPACGEGKLFRAYLKPVDSCAHCGEPLGHIHADDGPAWATVMVTGHVVVTLLVVVEAMVTMPAWLSITAFSGLSAAMVFGLLQPMKGLFIAILWHMKAPGAADEPRLVTAVEAPGIRPV